jgi:hypothetical protein
MFATAILEIPNARLIFRAEVIEAIRKFPIASVAVAGNLQGDLEDIRAAERKQIPSVPLGPG